VTKNLQAREYIRNNLYVGALNIHKVKKVEKRGINMCVDQTDTIYSLEIELCLYIHMYPYHATVYAYT